jgi:prepilin-type N-terminal cleavage/methylation domain-containing protein
MDDSTHKRGVTLIEMLVVLGVVAMLASMILVLTLRVENQSGENIVANAFTVLKSALREYYEYTGKFPDQPDRVPDKVTALAHIQLMYTALESVPASREAVKGVDSILVQKHGDPAAARTCDPWGTTLNYVYVAAEDNFPELISAGADRQFGTPDDISSKGK